MIIYEKRPTDDGYKFINLNTRTEVQLHCAIDNTWNIQYYAGCKKLKSIKQYYLIYNYFLSKCIR